MDVLMQMTSLKELTEVFNGFLDPLRESLYTLESLDLSFNNFNGSIHSTLCTGDVGNNLKVWRCVRQSRFGRGRRVLLRGGRFEKLQEEGLVE
ncbi:hypothetical protein GYH30_022745 [Glycine max]|nr:hypothetical protein GYH30_022745 [Glycine max]